jgi:hypothetical protein
MGGVFVHRQASHNITFGDTWGDEMTDIVEALKWSVLLVD